MISPLLSITSFCKSNRSCLRVSAVLRTPRSSSNASDSRNSLSAYEAERTLLTLAESGLPPFVSVGLAGLCGETRPTSSWVNRSEFMLESGLAARCSSLESVVVRQGSTSYPAGQGQACIGCSDKAISLTPPTKSGLVQSLDPTSFRHCHLDITPSQAVARVRNISHHWPSHRSSR